MWQQCRFYTSTCVPENIADDFVSLLSPVQEFVYLPIGVFFICLTQDKRKEDTTQQNNTLHDAREQNQLADKNQISVDQINIYDVTSFCERRAGWNWKKTGCDSWEKQMKHAKFLLLPRHASSMALRFSCYKFALTAFGLYKKILFQFYFCYLMIHFQSSIWPQYKE